jgi:phosphomannomutase
MKFTLEHTETLSLDGDSDNVKVTMEHDGDYLRADVFFSILARACIAYGWHPDAVADRIKTGKGNSSSIEMNYPKMP